MAGIGFELKRLFAGKGMLAAVRAYSYAAVTCAGPMILGTGCLVAPRTPKENIDAMVRASKSVSEAES